jgi:PAS domain S-box-containing protein
MQTTKTIQAVFKKLIRSDQQSGWDSFPKREKYNPTKLEKENEELKQKLRQAEISLNHYSELYNFAPTGYISVNAAGNINRGNLIAAKILNVNRSNLYNSSFYNCLTESSKPVFEAFLQQSFADNKIHVCEIELLTNCNAINYIILEGKVSRNERLCYISMLDITARKNAEAALLEIQNLYTDLVANQSVGIFRLITRKTTNGSSISYSIQYEFVNSMFAQMFGEFNVELLTQNNELIHHKFHAEDFESFQQSNYQATNDLQPYSWEGRIWVDGKIKWIHFESSPRPISETEVRWTGVAIDISKRKYAEEQVKNKEEKSYQLLEMAGDAFFQGDENGNLLMVNNGAVELTGYSKEELCQMNISQLLTERIKKTKPLQYHLLLDGSTIKNEREIVRKDGIEVAIEMCSKRMPDGTYQSFFRDITERIVIEKALKESEERHRLLIENLPIGVSVYQQNRFVYVNPKGLEMVKAKNSYELANMPISAFIHPDYRNQIIDKLEQLTPGEQLSPYQEQLICRDGSCFTAEVSALGIVYNHKPAILIITNDITERKKAEKALKDSEERYKILLNSVTDYVYSVMLENGTATRTFHSIGSYNVTGYWPDEYIANPFLWYEIIYPDDRTIVLDFTEKLARSEIVSAFEHRIVHKNGSIRWVRNTHVPQFDEYNNIVAYDGLVSDITQRKQAEEALIQSEAQLRELNASKDKLFSIIAHDLRNPFNSLLGFSDLLFESINECDKASCERYALYINTIAKNTYTLLENLLVWAKSQTKQLSFQPCTLDVSVLFEEMSQTMNSVALLKDIKLEFIQNEYITIKADENLFSTIMRNLITNAIKYSNPGSSLKICAEKQAQAIKFSVIDHGLGMDEETKNKLFSLNINTSKLGTANEKGSGLGLVLCKEFVEKHGGRIWVESEPEKGSTFSFTIPL